MTTGTVKGNITPDYLLATGLKLFQIFSTPGLLTRSVVGAVGVESRCKRQLHIPSFGSSY